MIVFEQGKDKVAHASLLVIDCERIELLFVHQSDPENLAEFMQNARQALIQIARLEGLSEEAIKSAISRTLDPECCTRRAQ